MRMLMLVAVTLQLAGANASADRTPIAVPNAAAEQEQQAVNPKAAAVHAFQERLKEYVAWRNKVESKVPQLTETADPEEIARRETALGEALIKARGSDVKPGEYFVQEFVPVLKETIKNDFAKRTAAERKALIVELPKGMTFGINQIYPSTIPLATFPANLLKALPDLPPELEYRIVNQHLILRDVEGNYVVDIVRDVFPIPM